MRLIHGSFLCMIFSTSGLIGCAESDSSPDGVDSMSSIGQAVNGNCPANYYQYSIHLDNDGGPLGPGVGRFISGWAFDNNDPGSSILVKLDTGGVGYEWQCAYFIADQRRDDVNNYCGITGMHGFSFVVPDSCFAPRVGITIDGLPWWRVGVN
jgi:hypothetical protein